MALKTVTQYVRRSPYQAIAATLIMTFTFYMISTFAIRALLSLRLIGHFESKPQLTVFFKIDTKKEDIDTVKKQLESTGKTSHVVYISKEEALKIYTEQNRSDPLLLDLVTADILPASLEIQAVKPEYLYDLVSLVKQSSAVEETIFQKEIVDKLVSWIDVLKRISLVEISVLVLESILVILTIIAFKITTRREEIEIIKLLGASDWFIRTPFLLEGMFYSAMGAFLGWLFAIGVLWYVTPSLQFFLKGIPILPIPPILLFQLLGIELLSAGILGAFASFLAVLRYLK